MRTGALFLLNFALLGVGRVSVQLFFFNVELKLQVFVMTKVVSNTGKFVVLKRVMIARKFSKSV